MIKVEIVNVMSVGTRCGHGYGRTLEQAQSDALVRAKSMAADNHAWLDDNGYRVYFSGSVNL